MNRWLENEAKWSREKAVEAQTELDNPHNPEWRAGQARRLNLEAQSRINAGRALEIEAESYTAPELVAELIARKEREVADWMGLAEQASNRLTDNEETALFETEDA